MRIHLKAIEDQTIVITGASSGIGLATARAAAAQGARVTLVARNADAVLDAAEQIEAEGGQAIGVGADVADRDQLEAAADETVGRLGAIDTWVNAAGVDVWGRLQDVSDQDSRRLFETNFWGVVNGSLVAAERIGSGTGSVINVGSIESDRAFPLQGMYAASKHSVKGFTEAFLMELAIAKRPISVSLIKPGSVGTPLPDHAKTYLERGPRLPEPLSHPDEVAHAILSAAHRPVRDVYVGGQARLVASLAKRIPGLFDLVSERVFVDPQLSDESAAGRRDNLHEAGRGGEVIGRSVDHLSRSIYTRAALRPFITASAAGAVAVAATLLVVKRQVEEWNA